MIEKSGLGSGSQLRSNIFKPIIDLGKKDEFYYKFNDFLKYVYEDDVYIVLKSHYKISFFLIPNLSFVNTLLDLYKNIENKFETVFYRWENNNLRLNWINLINYMDYFKYPYCKIDLILDNIDNNKKLKKMKLILNQKIEEYLKSNL